MFAAFREATHSRITEANVVAIRKVDGTRTLAYVEDLGFVFYCGNKRRPRCVLLST